MLHISAQTLIFIAFAGKDVGKIFENHVKMFDLVPASFSRKEDHQRLFTTMHLIFQKTRLSRFLSEVERNDLESNILNLSKIIFLRFKTMSITTKMHHVLVHTVDFVREAFSN